MQGRSIKQRLARLEELEAQAEQERQVIEDLGIPDLADLDDDEVLWEVTLGLQSFALHNNTFYEPPIIHLKVGGLRTLEWTRFYEALVTRAQPLFDTMSTPFLPLALWQAEEVIAALDAGKIELRWLNPHDGGPPRSGIYLVPIDRNDKELDRAIRAVDCAVDLVAWQLGLPQVGDWEMKTLEAWRQWLAGLVTGVPYDHCPD